VATAANEVFEKTAAERKFSIGSSSIEWVAIGGLAKL